MINCSKGNLLERSDVSNGSWMWSWWSELVYMTNIGETVQEQAKDTKSIIHVQCITKVMPYPIANKLYNR